ncbi:MAG: helix-turn-helix transcriptional regulator [Clostridia bacterium]|nr:helix-turn-helix transcriptional regulator [Clostridia bacterium]
MENLKTRLRALRTERGISQNALAQAVGVTRAAVNAWETGRGYPNAYCLVQLSRYLNTTSDYLLGLTNSCSIDISALPQSEREIVLRLVSCFQKL